MEANNSASEEKFLFTGSLPIKKNSRPKRGGMEVIMIDVKKYNQSEDLARMVKQDSYS